MSFNDIIEQYINHPMHKNLNMSVHFGKESAAVSMTIHESILNLVGTLHGAIYFKLIDDSCFFAALSAKESHFVATSNMTIHYVKPASEGNLVAKANIITKRNRMYLCKSTIMNDKEDILAYGSGSFIEPKKTYDYQERFK
tara:strand:- start:126 stop:548 length:423 start_codon:yes stop_codon:yes gene_type:complete